MRTMTSLDVPQHWEQLRRLVIDNHEPVRIEMSPTDRAILLAETDYQQLIDILHWFNDSDSVVAESSLLFEHLEIYRLVKSREHTETDQYLDHQEMLIRFGVTENDLCD